MKRKNVVPIFITIITFCMLLSTNVLAADTANIAKSNATKFGIFTILPPLIAIVLAFITKNVVISLFTGVFVGCFMVALNGNNVFLAFFNGFLDVVQRSLNSLADPWNAGIILQCMVIGGVIALVAKMGGAKAVAEALSKKAKTPRSAQIITWLLGILVFFDDYANSLIVGPIMRPVTDKMKVSREKLAFIVDATAAPISGIAIISTWVGYEMSLIKKSFENIGQTVEPFGLFVDTIPYRFYNILIIVFVVCTALFLREFGPMYKAERRARTTGKVLADDAKPMVSDEATEMEPKEGVKLSVWNAIIPIGVLIVGALLGFYYSGYTAVLGGKDAALKGALTNSPFSFNSIQIAYSNSDASVVLFQSALLATLVAIGMGVAKKIFTVSEAIETWVTGMKSLIITGVILILAWSLSGVIKDLGTADYLVLALSSKIPQFLLPSIIFILGSIISFATGTSYGTMGILMPLTIPLAYAISPAHSYVVMNTGAVLAGAIFGDHCSPISDTTILSSMGTACDHLDHTKTQIFYSLFVALACVLVGYIPAGLGVPIYIVLPLGIILIVVSVYLFGKPVDDKACTESKIEKSVVNQ